MQQQWHFAIPFFYGVNNYVTGRGGAPVNNKIAYLSKTIDAILARIPSAEIIVTVCNRASEEAALSMSGSFNVIPIDSPPLHLPYNTVKFVTQKLSKKWTENDIFAFNEDDQILYLSDAIKNDIEQHGSCYFFTPHRWIKGGGGRKFRKAPRYQQGTNKGIIDNVYAGSVGTPVHLNNAYRTQRTRLSAYAACWATHCSSLQRLDFTPYDTNPETICLETASFLLLDTALPILKTDLAIESPESFLVDHLSGQDYFLRRFSLKRLFNHLRRMKF